MARLWFDPPVSVMSARPGVVVAVSSVERASELLLSWREHGPKWRAAVQASMDAISGAGTAGQAREAFIAAAAEAGRLV